MTLTIALTAGGLWYFLGRDPGGTELKNDGKDYELTVPRIVAGEYKLDNPGETDEEVNQDNMKQVGVKRARGIDPVYRTRKGDDRSPSIDFDGVWGEIADPQQSLDRVIADPGWITGWVGISEHGAKAVGEPKPVAPAGLDNAVMKCQVFKEAGADYKTVCVWADYSTIGVVEPKNHGAQSGKKVSVEEAAQIASDLRDEARREVK
ncbi:hypothetical protein [Streptomyces sp. NPDC048442]|uniref:hypothetical protein n=1 Tax=Streptomyces sp. NPDC048442 TaxID=3154823 RepID=UPI00342DDC67